MGSFAVTGCIFAYSWFDYKDKKKSYDNLGPKESQSTFDSKYDEKKKSYNIMLYSGALWGLIYLASWVDMLFITDSPGVIISGIPFNGGYIAFDMFNKHEPFIKKSIEEMNYNLSYKIKF